MKKVFYLASLLMFTIVMNAQENDQKTDTLKEVVISSSRIDLPFKENSRTNFACVC